MAESLASSTQDLPKISSIPDAPLPNPDPPTAVSDTSHTIPDEGSAVTISPSSKRPMARQSSAVLSQSQCRSSSRTSTDELIESLASPAPSPSKKGKKKAQEVPQPVASSSDTMQDSLLPAYLVPNPTKPGGRESVESAMRRTETNLTILASKLEAAQTTISDDISGIRADSAVTSSSSYLTSQSPPNPI
jgi:hypothetical protein